MSQSGPAQTPEAEAPACELRQAQFGLFLLRVLQADWWAIQGYVADRVASAPGLLEEAAVLLDLDALAQLPSAEQAADLIDRLRAAGVRPIAIACAPGEQARELSRLFDLPSVPPERGRRRGARAESTPVEIPAVDVAEARTEPQQSPPQSAAPAEAAVPAIVTEPAPVQPEATAVPATSPGAAAPEGPMVVNQPVRSGQQLYARGRDLVVTGAVSAGAEVIADGSIHIWGRLSGKALAGARGSEQARIYCLDFQPELVSIAGHYRLADSFSEAVRGRPVQVLLDGEKLDIRALAKGPLA